MSKIEKRIQVNPCIKRLFMCVPDARTEPLVSSAHSTVVLGDIPYAIKWSFHTNTHSPQLILDGDHTNWSMC